MFGTTVVLDGELSLLVAQDGDCDLLTEQDGEIGIITAISDRPAYTGPTEVDPEFNAIVLPTAQKTVLSDITVNAIQVESVSNPSGGRTVYIGGII